MKTLNYDEETKEMFGDSVESFMLRLKHDPDHTKTWRELAAETSRRQHNEKTTRKHSKRKKVSNDADNQRDRRKSRKLF